MFTPKRQEMVGIEFCANVIKFAHLKLSYHLKEIVNFFSRNIQGLSDADIVKVISASITELKVKRPYLVGILPTPLVISKNIEVPSVDPQEIRQIINLQASRHTPYSREEIIVDYIDINTYKNNYTKILLLIVDSHIVKRQFELVSNSGYKLEKMLLASEGISWATSKILHLETKTVPAILLHLDEESADFTVVFRNKAIFIRSIPIGLGQLVSEKEKYQGKFGEELRKSLEAYQLENIEKNPNILILTGSEEVRDLSPILSPNFPLPIKTLPYLQNLAVSSQLLQSTAIAKNASFLDVISGLLAYDEMRVDLTPEEIKLKNLLEQRGRDLIKSGIFVLTLFALVFSICLSRIYFKSIYLKKLNTRYEALNQEAQKLEKDFARINLIRNYFSGRGYSLEILTELYNAIPLDMELSEIKFDRQKRISVRGSAEAMSLVFTFVDNLSKSKYFKEVETKYTTKRKEAGVDLTDFEVTCALNKEWL